MNKNRKFNPQVADVSRKIIGEHFRKRRVELGLSQEDVAQCAGIKQRNHISRFENGLANLTINNLLALGGCLRMKLYFEDSDPNTPAGFENLNEN